MKYSALSEAFEDLLEEAQVDLQPLRKKNSKRPMPPWTQYLLACYRKVIETTGSLMEHLLPKHIHAVTPQGFELKLALFVLATSFNSFKVATLEAKTPFPVRSDNT